MKEEGTASATGGAEGSRRRARSFRSASGDFGTAVPMAAWPGLSVVKPAVVAMLPDGLTPIAPLSSDHKETREISILYGRSIVNEL